MIVARLFFPCSCGGEIQPATVWVSADQKLCVEGICGKCTELKSVFYRLSFLAKMAEKFGGPLRPPLLMVPRYTKEDISLLADMNISLKENEGG